MGPPLQTVHILDAGCGSAYLTFAAARHLGDARIIGVDSNAELIGKCVATRDRLGGGAIDFRVSSIAQFEPEAPVDVVLSLHACDTATDEALAKGVQWKSRVILAAPCCQHELHRKLGTLPHFRVGEEQSKGPCGGNEGASLISFAPVLRHGLLRERLADILTDAFRALALKVMGYRVQVVEFVSPEHTSKNLMLRAVRAHVPGNSQAVAEYLALKDFWHVTPAIETLLGDEFRRRVAR